MKTACRFNPRWMGVVAVASAAMVIAAWSPALEADDLFQCRPGSTLDEIARAVLPAKTEFAHMPVPVSLPPSDRSVVVLFRYENDVNTNYQGWILVPEGLQCSYRKYPLPAMDEAPTLFDIEVQAVFGAAIEAGKTRALVVLYRYHRNGSANDSGYASYVYGWNGHAFESLSKLGEQVVGLKTAAQVRRKLLTAR